ncbi:MAG TPA: 50S ribosomal protein L23 [Clostridiales bacterium]|nr:50S ribosomal protein L23 [Clostridiales bacterium]
MKDIHDIIKRPILSEKSYDLIPTNRYTFEVDVKANKTQIRAAVEEIFGVTVSAVTTSRKQGKMKRQGRTQGRRPEVKKAYVTLTEDSKKIEFFESMAQ